MADRFLFAVLAALAASTVAFTAPATAHWVQPEEIIRRLDSGETRKAFGIEEVKRDPSLPRLLVVRVGPGWSDVAAAQRIEAAEEWNHMWRSSVPSGILAILDAHSDKALVNFDTKGNAVLK